MTEHRLTQHRVPAQVVTDDAGRPVRAVLVLADGDTVRLDTPAEIRRTRCALAACEDMLRAAKGAR